MKIEIEIPDELHKDTANLVKNFAAEIATKLRSAELKYGFKNGWASTLRSWPAPECQNDLLEHLEKGDPRDVAIYCAFLWYHKLPTKSQYVS